MHVFAAIAMMQRHAVDYDVTLLLRDPYIWWLLQGNKVFHILHFIVYAMNWQKTVIPSP